MLVFTFLFTACEKDRSTQHQTDNKPNSTPQIKSNSPQIQMENEPSQVMVL